MKFTDQQLGMDANISRRDFLNGVSVAIGASLLPSSSGATDVGRQDLAGYYHVHCQAPVYAVINGGIGSAHIGYPLP